MAELGKVQSDLKPLLVGQASKPRVMLIQAYISQLEKLATPESALQVLELLKSVVIDLISGYSSSNTKLRALSEDSFSRIFAMLANLNGLPALF